MTSNHHVIAILGDVAEYINGRAFKPSEWGKEGLPIIRIKNLNDENSKFNYSNEVFEKRYLVKKGDLLFAWSASLGAYIWKKDEAWLNQHIFLVKPSPFIAKLYLYYFLDKITQELYSAAHGSGMVHVTKKKFEETKIGLPPLSEQRSIVSKIEQLFSELDNGIACLKKAQEQLKVYRQAVLKQAFEGELTKSWREQQANLPSAQDLLDTIKTEREQAAKNQGKKLKPVTPLAKVELDELTELPDGWCWIKLGELTIGVEYGTSTKSLEKGEVPVIRMGNIQQGRIDWNDLAFTDDKADISKYRLLKGDVLFNRTNSPELVGKAAIYNGEMPAIFAGYLIRVNQIKELLHCKYLNFFLNSHPAKVYGNSVKTDGVNQSNINGEKLKSYPLPYCSPKEQEQIVQEIEARLSVCDNMEATIRESLEKAEALRQSILKKAFEGKLLSEEELTATRNDPDWEPAEKLLERIRAEKNQSKKQALT
ncbi:restriction endonuclease subunit S [Chlorobium phaeobacteroides]|uniref:Restriction modification system DNA specificity domain n=1 Tax=Chlorobium phaeobacteroides (strain DSM 266 / SMG 266 / 2430) TaxID=290317 RepID=A1BGI9_CHLPD|nr:restriction endonuclease subunit S [Chlorobium phaeobacteroides]ABL65516.1 restriction modification system DNA specificity domain [Chlorobium phaeobacteroides DSM 266]